MADNLTDLLRAYSTAPEDMEKLLAALRGKMEVKQPPAPDFITPAAPATLQPVVLDSIAARDMGIPLGADWLLKLIPDDSERGYAISFLTPENWEITEAWKYISPEGKQYDYTEMEQLMAGMGTTLPRLAPGAEAVYGTAAIKNYLASNPDQFMSDLGQIGRTDETVAMLKELGAGDYFIDYVFMGEEEAATWVENIWLAGRSAETEEILKDLFPGVKEEQLTEFFKDAPAPYIEEHWIKDVADAFYKGLAEMWYGTRQAILTELPLNMFSEHPFYEPLPLRFLPTFQEVTGIRHERSEQFMGGLREKFILGYLERKAGYDEWVKEHPELKPPPEWEGGTLETIQENPAILKEPSYWAYVAADSFAFTLTFLATTISVTFVTKNPWLGLAAGVAITTPAQSHDLYADLVESGASHEQAAELSVPIGALISCVEVVGGIPVLKALMPGVFRPLRKTIQHEIGIRVLGALAKKGVTSVAKIELAEVFEEIVQGAIQDATVKYFDENRDILGNIPETTIRTAMATLPLALIGGGSSVAHFYAAMPDEQRAEFDSWVTKLKEAGIDEEHAKLIAAGKLLETPEGQATLAKAIEAVEVTKEATPAEVLSALMVSLDTIMRAKAVVAEEVVAEPMPMEAQQRILSMAVKGKPGLSTETMGLVYRNPAGETIAVVTLHPEADGSIRVGSIVIHGEGLLKGKAAKAILDELKKTPNLKMPPVSEMSPEGLKVAEKLGLTPEAAPVEAAPVEAAPSVVAKVSKAKGTATSNTYEGALQTASENSNIWIKSEEVTDNAERTLFVQFSNLLMGEAEDAQAKAYYDLLYEKVPGYKRSPDFWEIPEWIPHTANSVPNADVYIVRNIKDAIKEIGEAGYKNIMISALDVNVAYIKELAKGINTPIIVGGYVSPAVFKGIDNITFENSIEAAMKVMGLEYHGGLDYRHFEGTETIPRLCLSIGCLHKCAFCVVGKGVTEVSRESIDQQVEAISKLKATLVYIDDKTLGQAKNYKYIQEIYTRLKEINTDFEGFIVQTTASQLLKLSDAFLKASGIKYVELGVESYNDPMLRALHKPATVKIIDRAVQKIRANGLKFVPNILIGTTARTKAGKVIQETTESYKNTLAFLRANMDIISHVNIYNLAIYEGTELAEIVGERTAEDINENIIAKSFHEHPRVHAAFAKKVYALATEIITGRSAAEQEAASQITEIIENNSPHLVSMKVAALLEEHEKSKMTDEIAAKIKVFRDFLKGLDEGLVEAKAKPEVGVTGLKEAQLLKEELTGDTLTRKVMLEAYGETGVEELIKQTNAKIKEFEAAKAKPEEVPPRATKSETQQIVNDLIFKTIQEQTEIVPVEDVVKKLTQLIKEAEPAREATEKLKHEELVARAGKAAAILNTAEGKEAFERSKSALQGALPKADFAPPELQMTDADIKSLYKAIQDSELKYFAKLNTAEALTVLLSGKIPTIGELTRLEKMFGSELIQAVIAKKSLSTKAWWIILDTLNIPRAVLASWDLSAPLRQAAPVFWGQPAQTIPALKPMVQAFFTEKYARMIDETIKANPYYEFSQELKNQLYIAPLYEMAAELTQREEAFMSRFARWIPLVKHSERAYVLYLNKVRMDIFSSYCRAWEGTGKTMADYNSLARAINVMTGRGDLGKLKDIGGILNALLFSPRYQVSRIMLPVEFVRATPVVRKMMARNIVAFVAANCTILSLWLLSDDDASIEFNPNSADFGKLKIGNTRVDFWAGFQPYFRLVWMLVSGVRKSSTTGKLSEVDKEDLIFRFLRTKYSPALGLVSDILRGETFAGDELSLEPESVKQQFYERLAPMFVQDVLDAVLEDGLAGGLMALPGLLGVGIQTYGGGYWDEFIDMLGLPKQADTLPYSVNKEDIYTTKDFYSDISPRVQGLKPEDIEEQYHLPDMVQSIIECKATKITYTQRPAERYIDLNADPLEGDTYQEYFKQWQEWRRAITEEDKAKIAEQYPHYYMGNIGRNILTLLTEYHSLDSADQQIFLEQHPELRYNAREQWLINNPNGNALLALWGQAKIMTQAAYTSVNNLIEKLDIPLKAVEFNLPPPGSVDNYFKYQDIVTELGANSWEARLLMLEDDVLREWLGRDPIEDNPVVLEIQAKHRALTTEYEGYKDKDSPYYIENEDARAEKQQAFKLAHPDWTADMHRVDAYARDFPEGQIDYYVTWYMGFTKKPEDMETVWYDDDRWLMEHMDFYNAMFELGVWTKHRDWAVVTNGVATADPTKIPTVKEENWLIYYDNLPTLMRLQTRCRNEALDAAVVKWFGLKPCYGTDRCGGDSAGVVHYAPPEEEEETGLDKDWAREHWEEFTKGIVNQALLYGDGDDFLRELGIDPGMHPSFLTEEQAWLLVEALEDKRKTEGLGKDWPDVLRMVKSMEEGKGQFEDWAREDWDSFSRAVVLAAEPFGDELYKELGIDRSIKTEDLDEEQVFQIGEAIVKQYQEKLLEADPKRFEKAFQKWLREWAVPDEEAEGWASYPATVKFLNRLGGYYLGYDEGIVLDFDHVNPSTLAHELAHANYFENLPESMRNIYPYAHYLAQVISPKYREQLIYGGCKEEGCEIYPGQLVDKAKLPTEGYAVAYARYAKSPETMPWYIEPFYGNLMYEVPEEAKGTLAWLACWLRWKLEQSAGNIP